METVTVRRRKTRGQREERMAELPVETVEYRLPEDAQVCERCDSRLHEMSEQVRRERKIVPAQVKVVEHVQYVYHCRRCEREATATPATTAPMPAPPIPGGLASPSALGSIMNQKFVEGLPLYRQKQEFARLGVELSRQTLANWLVAAAERSLATVYDRLHQHLRVREIPQADETELQVLHEPGQAAQTKSFM